VPAETARRAVAGDQAARHGHGVLPAAIESWLTLWVGIWPSRKRAPIRYRHKLNDLGLPLAHQLYRRLKTTLIRMSV
jgi:hypothetical protein